MLNSKNLGFAISGALVLMGGISGIRGAGTSGMALTLSGSVAALATTVAIGSYESELSNRLKEMASREASKRLELETALASHKTALTQAQGQLSHIQGEYARLEQILGSTSTRTVEALPDNSGLYAEIERLKQAAKVRQASLMELVDSFTTQIKSELSGHVEQCLGALSGDIEARLERLPAESPTAQSLVKLLDTVLDKQQVFREIIEALAPDHNNPLNDITEFSDVFGQLHQESAALKVRYRNTLNTAERLTIHQLQQQQKAMVARDSAVTELKKVYLDREQIEAAVTTCSAEIDDLLSTIERQREQIADLQQQAAQANKPMPPVQWRPELSPTESVGNAIIRFLNAKGFIVDRGLKFSDGWQYRYAFHGDRNPTPPEVEELNKHSEALQDLLGARELVKFARSPETGLIECVVVTGIKPKPPTSSRDEIDKLWVSASQFEELAATWSRVRVTGGSEAGKSPTAENIAVCLLKARPGKAKLYNPQHDSAKNYWTIPAVGRSHSDNLKGIKALADRVQARSDGEESRDIHEIVIFDEIDSTMGKAKNRGEIGKSISFIIKQASHQNLSAIFTGQNANVSEYPGMNRSDWNSAINLHIGANANDAIINSNQYTAKEKNGLQEKCSRIADWCREQNEKLGLSASDPKAYRFAMVVCPTRGTYFIELPEFGKWTYSPNQSTNNVDLESSNVDSEPPKRKRGKGWQGRQSKQSETPYVGVEDFSPHSPRITCPSCGTDNVKIKSQGEKSSRYYCKNPDCSRQTFTVKHL